MKPRQTKAVPQKDLFQPQLVDIINPIHPLVRLAKVIDWNQLDDELGGHFSTVGTAALPTRLMMGLLYLQHLHDLSDEIVLVQSLESPYYQYFCGETFFQHDFLCHPSSLVKWRNRLGEEGFEWLLTQTIQAGLTLKVIKPASLKRVVVDTTVQERNVTFPTDAKLYNKARQQLTQKQEGTLNQAYRLLKQTRQSKNKLYSLYEFNVDCISKGKAQNVMSLE